MSIFVGNISKNVKKSDLQDEFEKFGKCEINHKVPFLSSSPPLLKVLSFLVVKRLGVR